MSLNQHIIRTIAAGAILTLCISGLPLSQNQARAADEGSAAGASVGLDGARSTYSAAMRDLVLVRQAAMKVAKEQPEYREAAKRVEETHAAYIASQKKVTTGLGQSNEKYQGLLQQRDAIERELSDLRGGGTHDPTAFAELHNKKIAINQQIKAIEDQGFDASGSTDLKKQWQDACKALEVVEIRLIAKCEQAPLVVENRNKAEQAERNLQEAGVQYATAKANVQEQRRQEYQQNLDQRRQEVMNWASYGGWGWNRSWSTRW